jgi:REP element-mobilizing transposase RayT
VTQRATDHEILFVDGVDRREFDRLLALAGKRARWKLHAFCQMTNHVHLLIQTPEPTLPRGMQFLMSTYVQEFNLRHGRRGALVQGRYKAILVETDEHYLACLEYFAMNPVAAGLCARPEDWPWSSYAGDGRVAPRIGELLAQQLDVALL